MFKFIKRIFGKNSGPQAPSAPQVPSSPITNNIDELIINPSKLEAVKTLCLKFKNAQERYEYVSSKTGVPSDVLFAIHLRECSADFRGVLHNGERILGSGKKTKLVPAGRGPFETWEEAAIDAMEIEKKKFPASWDLAGKFDFCEKYNGLGYRKKGIPSPYVFAWTNGYSKGKYVADGKFDSNHIDQQCGTAAIILSLRN